MEFDIEREQRRNDFLKIVEFAEEVLDPGAPFNRSLRTTFLTTHGADLQQLKQLGAHVRANPDYGTAPEFARWTESTLARLQPVKQPRPAEADL